MGGRVVVWAGEYVFRWVDGGKTKAGVQIETLAGAKSGGEEEICEQDEKHCQCRQSGPEAGGENLKIEHMARAVLCYRIVLIKVEFGWVDHY